MPVVEDNRLRLHTQELGGAGPPVVMLHGLLFGALTSWYFVAPVLARTKRVLLYDFRGHGRSERSPSGYGMRSMAADLASLVDRFSNEPVSLVGHSYGGVVALRYAIDHPHRVHRLVIVEAPLPALSEDTMKLISNQTPEEVFSLIPEALMRHRRRLRSQLLDLTVKTTLLADLQTEPDIADAEIASFPHPVLLCYGTQSPTTRSSCARLQRLLPHVQLTVIEGTHFLPFDAPEPLAEAISGFLDG